MSARALFLFFVLPAISYGATVSYEFDIDTRQVNITGTDVEALTIADQIPAPLGGFRGPSPLGGIGPTSQPR